MAISRDTLRIGLYVGLGALFIAVIGMLTVFSERYIIAHTLTLSTTILLGTFLAAGFYAARHTDVTNLPGLALNGAAAAAIIALILAALALFRSQINVQPVFPNVTAGLVSLLSFGQEQLGVGLLQLIASGAIVGALGSLSTRLPARVARIAALAVTIVIVLGLLQDQIKTIISLLDAAWVVALVTAGYGMAVWRNQSSLLRRVAEAALVSVGLGALFTLLLGVAGASSESVPAWLSSGAPILQSFILGRSTAGLLALLALAGGALGATGAALSTASATAHRLGVMVLVALLMLGILNYAGEMTLAAALAAGLVMVASHLILERTASQAGQHFSTLNAPERRSSQIIIGLAGLAFALVIPQLLTGYINNVIDLVGLYVMMGLGLNIVVGYAGLLDLGYVAFFAIGAYTTGVLTTPNVITCGGISPAELDAAGIAATCTGMTTFWVAWPATVLISALAGVMLGIPVLRLRGDYLAIVTLGFGEIIRLVALADVFKPYFGGAQGVINIPSPSIDLSGLAPTLTQSGLPGLTQLGQALSQPIAFSRPNEVYYLILAGVIITAFVSYRLSQSRLGRAWRAMKEDEDVAQAMGINLVRAKLLAFSIGASFSGVGGAIFASYLKSIFPNSFTLLVSINVLSLIIIGGMGSIPGVFLGALVIFGLPEALREFAEFRLLMFGALLVVMMLWRPEGMLPPQVPRLEEKARKAFAQEGANQ